MGQTQFMPTSFSRYSRRLHRRRQARHLDQRARRARVDRELLPEGWLEVWGMPWGFEVTIPQGFDYSRSRASFAEWTRLGVKRADGGTYPRGDGILFFPTGVPGPGFIVTPNFDVIKTYNDSDVYALAIGHLADRMRGAGPIRGPWPKAAPSFRATTGSPCRRSSPSSATTRTASPHTSTSRCATSSAPSRSSRAAPGRPSERGPARPPGDQASVASVRGR